MKKRPDSIEDKLNDCIAAMQIQLKTNMLFVTRIRKVERLVVITFWAVVILFVIVCFQSC